MRRYLRWLRTMFMRPLPPVWIANVANNINLTTPRH